jgi:hypothetical protein
MGYQFYLDYFISNLRSIEGRYISDLGAEYKKLTKIR